MVCQPLMAGGSVPGWVRMVEICVRCSVEWDESQAYLCGLQIFSPHRFGFYVDFVPVEQRVKER
jgi:hypothetical protein